MQLITTTLLTSSKIVQGYIKILSAFINKVPFLRYILARLRSLFSYKILKIYLSIILLCVIFSLFSEFLKYLMRRGGQNNKSAETYLKIQKRKIVTNKTTIIFDEH